MWHSDVLVIPSTLFYTNKVLYSRRQYLFQQMSVDPLIIFIIFVIFSDNSGTISPIASPRYSTGGPLKQRLDSWKTPSQSVCSIFSFYRPVVLVPNIGVCWFLPVIARGEVAMLRAGAKISRGSTPRWRKRIFALRWFFGWFYSLIVRIFRCLHLLYGV